MENSFLGYAIRNRREELGLSQAELQRRVKKLSIERDPRLTEEEKNILLNQPQNSAKINGKYVYVSVSANLVSKIERGVARHILDEDLALIAEVLEDDVENYTSLEINPMNLMAYGDYTENVNTTPFFERAIEFEPEYRQAGVSILSFFSELVGAEFSGQSVRVGIMQNGNIVTLRVETPEGELLKEVEQALNQYGLVVMGKAPVDSVSENKQLVQELKTRLEVTNLELRLRQEAALTQSAHYESRISSLESQINHLHNLVGNNLVQQSDLIETIRSLANSTQPSEAFLSALDSITEVLHKARSNSTESQLKKSLGELERESPGILSNLASTLESIPASIAANLATPWVQSLILTMPK